MANPNPARARQAKRQRALADAGSVEEMRRLVWDAAQTAARIANDPAGDAAERLRGVHALNQAAGSFLRLVEACEYEARLCALEADARSRGSAL